MSWKKMIMGEKMPDKNDPNYHDRYVRDVNAGRKFAKAIKIDKIAVGIQTFANGHRKLFLAIVFGFITFCFSINVYRLGKAYSIQNCTTPAIQVQEKLIRDRKKKQKKTTNIIKVIPLHTNETINTNNTEQ